MSDKPLGLILCGGKSSRMLGQNKALVDFNGEPLLQRIKSRFQPQVDGLLLNLAANSEQYRSFDLDYVIDNASDLGPLMGLASAFEHTQAMRNIALCPCDATFIPSNLVAVLNERMAVEDADIVCPAYQGQLQPTFALWHRRTAQRVISATAQEGAAGLKELYSKFNVARVDWPLAEALGPSPFFNINTQDELSLALNYLK